MKRILFVIPTMRTGGAEKSLVTLLKAIGSGKYEIDLLLFEAGGPLQDEVPEWVNVREADLSTRAMTLEMRYYLKSLLKNRKLSAAFSRVYITLRSYISRKLNRKPYFSWGEISKHIEPLKGHYDVAIGYLEGFTDFYVIDKVDATHKIGWIHTDMSKRIFTNQEKDLYSKFDHIGTMSEICLNAFIKKVPECRDRISVIENIVIPEEIRKKADLDPIDDWNSDLIHLVSVGRLSHEKGCDLAVDACKILVEQGFNICWHWCGDGIMRNELEQKIKKLNLTDSFILEGMQSNPYRYMKRADVIVQPSRYEGKSIVLDEAKILGKPIVVTGYPSVYDQVVDRKTGYIVPITSIGIANGIRELINNKTLRDHLSELCRNSKNESLKALDKVYQFMDGDV